MAVCEFLCLIQSPDPVLIIFVHRLDAQKTPYMTEFASCWGMLIGSMLIASPIIFWKIKDSTAVEDDLAFSDETTADVMGSKVEGAHEYEKPEAHEDASAKA